MAVRIIDYGPDEAVIKKKICKNCGVTLEYAPHDVKEYEKSSDPTYRYIDYCIDCPNCDKKVQIGI